MPELPEVETTRRGIAPLVVGRTIAAAVLRTPKLRWPIPAELAAVLAGQNILAVERRAKYLLLRCSAGCILLHLGMSGHLRVVSAQLPPGRHDHVDLVFTDGSCLRFNDPRKFGAFLWLPAEPFEHPLLAGLGPEPFAAEMNGAYLHRCSRGRRLAVKPFMMDQRVVVGVGNIYASEALFRAGIHPRCQAGRISLTRYQKLALVICEVLQQAIAAGGTTIRDFQNASGKPGYFDIQLQVYGREGQPCPVCGQSIKHLKLGQRSTYFCSRCQR